MNASFGIDHPLLATHDINALRKLLSDLGFTMTPIGEHPWGTSTSLAMFEGCLLEIMGIYDASLIDEVPAGDFRFGRHVYEHLQQREGVALTALHSLDSVTDAEHAERAGLNVAGHLEFGRTVTLPNGATDRTKTTLALLPNQRFPRLSFFLCQQHRPELIYVPEWLAHPNTVHGICGVHIVAATEHHDELNKLFANLYSSTRMQQHGFSCTTANGIVQVLTKHAFLEHIGPLPEAVAGDSSPFIAGMDLSVEDPEMLCSFIDRSELPHKKIDNGVMLLCPERTANTVLRFLRKP